MMPVNLTLIVAYLLYHCQQPIRKTVCCNAKRYGRNCVQVVVVVIIVMLGLIVTLLVLYKLVIQVQVQVETG